MSTEPTLPAPRVHWELETRAGMEVDAPECPSVGTFYIGTETERPMRGTTPIQRKGNRSMPSMVKLEDEDSTLYTSMLPETARRLASALVSAANLADQIDQEDADDE